MTSRQLLSTVLVVSAVAVTGLSATRADTPRIVYITATDAKGAVTDLTADDLTVKEGGKDVTVASLAPATEPLDLVLLVDDLGSGVYQGAVLDLLKAFNGKAKFSISQFVPQAVKLIENTDDFSQLQDALNKLGPRGKVQGQGEQLVEAISVTAKALQARKAVRPVIVALTLTGGGQPQDSQYVMDTLQSTGAMLNVIYVSNAAVGQVVGDGPRQTGGMIERVGGTNGVPPAVAKLVDFLLHQYKLTYTLADGVKPSDRVAVATKRKGITLAAPTRIPK